MHPSVSCPRCKEEDKCWWGSTTNEWEYVCDRCNLRFNRKGQIRPVDKDKVESDRLNRLQLKELPGGGFLVRALREIGERLDKLEHNQRELVSVLKKEGLLKFRKTSSPYEPRQTPQ